MKRKLLSVLLVLAMVLSMVPVAVSAENAHTAGTHTASHVCEKCGASATWQAWTSSNSLPTSGHYYLTKDVTMSNQVVPTDNLCLCLNGYTITGAQNNKTIAVATANKFVAITDCTAVEIDGVYYAGKITGGKNTTTNGGTIYIGNNGHKLYFYDGIIENNRTYASGGGIFIANGSSSSKCGSVFMYGGQIRGNVAKNASNAGQLGGGIYVGNYGKCYVTGGKITGNETKMGGGIYAGANATVVVKNASVTGNFASERAGGVYMDTGTLSLQEEAIISGNTAVDSNSASNLHLNNTATNAAANTLKGNAMIGVTLAAARISAGVMSVTTAAAGTDAKYFISDSTAYEPKLEGNQVVLVEFVAPPAEPDHEHNGCGDASCTDHEAISYTKWTDSASLPTAGNYYLDTDVTLSNQTVMTGDLNLCLNGHTVNGPSGNRILTTGMNAFTLTLGDCTAKVEAGVYQAGKLTGAIKASTKASDTGGAIYIYSTATFYLFDGIIEGNQAHMGGGGIHVGGTMYMENGVIRNNIAGKGNEGKAGGGINMGTGAKLYITGGEISGNQAKLGGGIYVHSTATVEIGDTKILNNIATENGGGIYMADTPAITLAGNVQVLGNTASNKASNLVLSDKTTVALGALGAEAKVAVTASAFRYISGQVADCSTQFQSDVASLDVIYKDEKLFMDAADGHKHCLCSAATAGCDHSATKWAPWESATTLPTSGNYYLTSDVTVTAQTGLDNTQLNLCLNGYTIKADCGRVFYTKGDTQLSITDCTGKGIITGADNSAIMTEKTETSKAVVNVFGGNFVGNTTSGLGGAIVAQGGATLNIYHGTFEKNTSIGKLKVDANGDPILDDKGNQQADNAIGGAAIGTYGAGTTLNIYGGTFKDNATTHVEVKAASGSVSNKGGYGIIYIQGKANVCGGSFTGGEALLGGAFFVTGSEAELTIEKATITGNYAKGGGAIVLQAGAAVNLKDATIEGNECGSAGGGAIYVSANSQLNLLGGTIKGNTSPGNGGAIYVSEGTANLLGGEISGNAASVNGAAVYVNRATAVFNGTAIKNNVAGNNGGAIYGAGATLIQIDKSEISGNTGKNGAGIYATQNQVSEDKLLYSTVVVNEGALIKNNKAQTNGGGLMLVGKGSVLDLNGGTISDNKAKNAGGVLAQTGSTVNMKGGKITGNQASVGGGGMYISAETTLNMQGGTISGNDAVNNGGGMLVQRGYAKFTGGTISGNTATTAGGVYFAGAKADIYNVSITGNASRKNGGAMLIGANEYTQNGVKMTAVPVVNMYGGTISGNSAPTANAGAILVQSKGSTFNLHGGVISNNTCTVGGGGVYVAANTIMNMDGGTITGNEAKQGGAIFCQRGTLTVIGGKIWGNTATASAGAIYTIGNSATTSDKFYDESVRMGIVTVKNVEFYGNKAAQGGAFEVGTYGTLNMENCKVHDNIAEGIGGGVYYNKVCYGTLKNVLIYDNEAQSGGGGLAINVGSIVVAENITVENNRADGIGGGIYNRGRLELSDSVVRGNATTGNGGGIGTFKTSSIPLSVDAGLYVKNTLVTDNRSVKGAGLYLHVGCISELTDVTVEKNVSEGEGSGIYSNGRNTLTNVTITGNTSQTDLYALYFDASLYDGHTYYTGSKVLQGNIIVKDNQGGDGYLGEGTAIAIPGAGLGEDTYLPLDLHSGLLTQQVIGIYNYEGENLRYVITAGDRSITDPETVEGSDAQTAATENSDVMLYVAIGLFVAAMIAVAVILIAKKKKKSPAAGKE